MSQEPYSHKIFINEKSVLIHNNSTKNIISISKENGVIKYENPAILSQLIQKVKAIDVFGVLGIIKYDTSFFFLYVSKCLRTGMINHSPLYQVIEVNFLSLNNQLPSNSVSEKMSKFKSLITKKGFYYSPFYDFTKPYTSQKDNKPPRIQYMFNKELIDPFLFYKINPVNEFVSYLICGFSGCFYKHINNTQILSYILVRRNREYLENNLVEIEIVIVHNKEVFNYVIYSFGFNKKDDYLEVMTILSKAIFNQQYFTKNSIILRENNETNIEVLINILKQNYPTVSLHTFKLDGLSTFLSANVDLISQCDYFLRTPGKQHMQTKNFVLITEQGKNKSLVYTKNVIFETICFYLSQYESFHNIRSLLSQPGEKENSYVHYFDNCFANLIQISNSITSQDELIFEHFRSLKINKSCYQPFNPLQLSSVPPKSQTLHTMNIPNMNNNPQIKTASTMNISRPILSQIPQLNTIKKINTTIEAANAPSLSNPFSVEGLSIYALTWNVMFLDSDEQYNQEMKLMELLFPEKYQNFLSNTIPDMIIIGLQEIVELDTKNILSSKRNEGSVNLWTVKFQTLLEIQYELITKADLVGILFLCFAKKDIKSRITKIKTKITKTGFFGALGNKGFINIGFEYKNKTFAISTGQLTSGENSNSSRIKELTNILNSTFEGDNLKFIDNDYWFILGDLNFREEGVTKEYVYDCIKNKCLQLIKDYDQFLLNKDDISPLLKEGNITFYPTYKFAVRTRNYDITERVPSYCDRIFYKNEDKIKQLFYDSLDFPYSDHQPVASLFNISFN